MAKLVECPICDGKGWVYKDSQFCATFTPKEVLCPERKECPKCKGKGSIEE